MKLSTLIAAGLMLGATAIAEEAKIKITELSKTAKASTLKVGAHRVGGYAFSAVPKELEGAAYVFIPRGNSGQPGNGFSFTTDKAATVYLLYMTRGPIKVAEGWEKTTLVTNWKAGKAQFKDVVFKKDYPAGKIDIPVNDSKAGTSYGIPHTAVLIPTE